jgi:hypothetical protein
MDCLVLGNFGEQPQGALLPVDGGGAQAIARGDEPLGFGGAGGESRVKAASRGVSGYEMASVSAKKLLGPRAGRRN